MTTADLSEFGVNVGGREYVRKAALEGIIGRELPDELPALLSAAQAAKAIGKHKSTVSRWLKKSGATEAAA